MNWELISAAADVLGLVFLVVSVIYLSIQVKQGNAQAASDSLQGATQIYLSQYEKSYGSEERTAFMRKALNDYDALSQDEKGRFFSIMIGYIAAWDNIQNKYQAGLMREGTYESITLSFVALFRTTGGQACLKQMNELFRLPPVFTDTINDTNLDAAGVMPWTEVDFLKTEVQNTFHKK